MCFLLSIAITFAGALQAQVQQSARSVSGTVIDQNGEPVAGATVIEKGTANGTVTDVDGRFSLSAPDNAVLQVSFIGYITQEVGLSPAMRDRGVTVRLPEDTQALEEIVVVGYGTQRKVNLT